MSTFGARRALGLCGEVGCTRPPGDRSRCAYHRRRKATLGKRRRAAAAPPRVVEALVHRCAFTPWGEPVRALARDDGPRPRQWHEIVRSDRSVAIYSLRSAVVLRTLLAPGERLALAVRCGAVVDAKRWWVR